MSFGHTKQKSQSSFGPAFGPQRSQYGAELMNQGQGIFGPAAQEATGLLENPVSAQEQNALTQTAMQPVASSFDAAAQRAGERAARTRNPAGLLETDEALARDKGQQLSTAAENALLAGTKIADTRREAGLRSLAQLYGIDLDTLGKLLGGTTGTSSGSGGGFNFGLIG